MRLKWNNYLTSGIFDGLGLIDFFALLEANPFETAVGLGACISQFMSDSEESLVAISSSSDSSVVIVAMSKAGSKHNLEFSESELGLIGENCLLSVSHCSTKLSSLVKLSVRFILILSTHSPETETESLSSSFPFTAWLLTCGHGSEFLYTSWGSRLLLFSFDALLFWPYMQIIYNTCIHQWPCMNFRLNYSFGPLNLFRSILVH